MKFSNLLVLTLILAFLSGCADVDEYDSGRVGGGMQDGIEDASTAGYSETAISGMETGSGGSDFASTLGPEFNDPQNPLYERTIYFEYDSSQVKQEYVQVIYAHAQYLAANPRQRIILEGHADERGSREYNIALGEQRAHAIARMMAAQGVSRSQLESVSYGEEKPSVDGHDSNAWQQNRRVEIVYQGQ